MTIRLVTFDALHTLLTPRLPIYVQYAQTFAPFLGVLDPDSLKQSFKVALKQVQNEKPVYRGERGAQGWWSEVIKRTAIGAGAERTVVESSLSQMVPRLMDRFSSKEGYKLFDDALPVLRELREMNICTALISNTDARMKLVLKDLEVSQYLNPVLLSEEVGVEKPDAEIFRKACRLLPQNGSAAGVISPHEGVHVGDELHCDYHGAHAAGMHALLIRRPGAEGEGERKEEGEDLREVAVIDGLLGIVNWVKQHNSAAG
ncbi:HAD-superfamily hydrolase [Leucogyrophana mollusca]|uniref:HAD-superfamily hydrolase n=1 Tax=Leucogyrophana mollusca TaxID=85980 RepID=A0ACB8BL30_9AGAM|nr:HAD-superfamily hydrolase [Leucogyrophana mollusca]